MNINELTIGEVKELKSMFGGACTPVAEHPYQVGKSYLVRAVTLYYIGILKAVYSHELSFSSASWVADTGRYHDALKTGKLNEVEPILGDLIIGRGSIVDMVEWSHKPPMEQK